MSTVLQFTGTYQVNNQERLEPIVTALNEYLAAADLQGELLRMFKFALCFGAALGAEASGNDALVDLIVAYSREIGAIPNVGEPGRTS